MRIEKVSPLGTGHASGIVKISELQRKVNELIDANEALQKRVVELESTSNKIRSLEFKTSQLRKDEQDRQLKEYLEDVYKDD